MATSLNETKGFYKLSWLQRIGFGSGDLAQNLIFQTVATYLMIYLTTVLKINAAFVSGLILTVRLIDCFWSPVVGRYIDNSDGGCLPADASSGCNMVYADEDDLCCSELYRAEHDLFGGEHSVRLDHGQYDS